MHQYIYQERESYIYTQTYIYIYKSFYTIYIHFSIHRVYVVTYLIIKIRKNKNINKNSIIINEVLLFQ